MPEWDVAVGGLWESDLKEIEKEWPGYEVVEVRSEDGHHFTAYLRRKRRVQIEIQKCSVENCNALGITCSGLEYFNPITGEWSCMLNLDKHELEEVFEEVKA